MILAAMQGETMGWEGWVTIATIVLMTVALVRQWAGPDVVMLGGLTLLMTLSAWTDKLPRPEVAIGGFANKALIIIAVLYVVAAGLTHTGAMTMLAQPLLGRPRTLRGAQIRLMAPVAAMSAFHNNTPIVAMFMPVVSDWCKRLGIGPSKLFIPLSYAAILGGTCTLIGTATNIFVSDLFEKTFEPGELAQNIHMYVPEMFTITRLSLPVALVGLAYILLTGSFLLPDRRTPAQDLADARQYSVEMLVEPVGTIAGRTIEQAGLRSLPGVYLAEIERHGQRLVAVGPEQELRAGDRLIFVGLVESVVDLQKIRGLVPATDQVFKLSDPRPNRHLVEAVVSDSCPLVGKTIREGRFRTTYDAVIIAVHRRGEHLRQKLGDIVLQPGDTLLIESHPRFILANRNRSDFFLLSAVADSVPIRHDRAWTALAIMAAMVVSVSFAWLTLLNAAFLAAGLMVMTRCCSATEARASVDWRVLLVIGAALGIGDALGSSGAAEGIASVMLAVLESAGPHAVLAGVYLLAMVFSSLIGPVGAAALVFPIAKTAVFSIDANFMPFTMALMVAASASFATPIAYQTNLMVYGPGGYRFTDYLRIGLPLNAIAMAITVVLAPIYWPFELSSAP